jgi:hypothetical protein
MVNRALLAVKVKTDRAPRLSALGLELEPEGLRVTTSATTQLKASL